MIPSVLAGVVLAALVLVAALTSRRSLGSALLLGLLGVLWLLVNQPVEGATLVRVSADHGLTTADLAGLAALITAAVRAWLSLHHRRSSPTDSS